jgi:hypothetical protein
VGGAGAPTAAATPAGSTLLRDTLTGTTTLVSRKGANSVRSAASSAAARSRSAATA